MKEIPLTNYQLLAYFAPGFVVVFCFFMSNEPVHDWATLKLSLKEISIPLTAAALICSFIIGLFIDGLRNGFIEPLFKFKEHRLKKNKKINWDFFYQGKKEVVALFYTRYFTYYCFDINLVLAIVFSIAMLDVFSQLPHKLLTTILFCIGAIVLLVDGVSLRSDMAKATNFVYPSEESDTSSPSAVEEP